MLKRSKKSGFTLLELLIVVIIVSILAAVALPRFGRMTRRARSAEASVTVGAILTAELLYYQENTSFVTGALPIAALLVDANLTNFTYSVTASGTASATATATGTTAGNTALITVTGTLNNDGFRTQQVIGGL